MTTLRTGRLRYPRASHLSTVLLVAVFSLFALWLGLAGGVAA